MRINIPPSMRNVIKTWRSAYFASSKTTSQYRTSGDEAGGLVQHFDVFRHILKHFRLHLDEVERQRIPPCSSELVQPATRGFHARLLINDCKISITLHIRVASDWKGEFDGLKAFLVHYHVMKKAQHGPVFILSCT